MFSCNRKSGIQKINIETVQNNIFTDKNSTTFLCNNIEKNEIIKLDNLIEDYLYVKLETSDSCLIGKIDQISIKNDRIYIADYNQSKSFYVFNKQGRSLFTINREGKGPGEYTTIQGFSINESMGEIVLLVNGCRLLVFDFMGKYKKEIVLGIWCVNFKILMDKYYIIECGFRNNSDHVIGDPYNILYYDLNGKILKKSMKYKFSTDRHYVNFTSLQQNEDEILYKSYLDNILWAVSEDTMQVYCTIDYEDNTPPEDFWNNFRANNDVIQRNKKINKINYVQTHSIKQIDNLLFCLCSVRGNVKNAIFNTQNKKCIAQGDYFVLSTGKSLFSFASSTLEIHSEGISFIIEPFLIVNNQNSISDLGPKEVQAFSDINEQSNPIIFFAKLK